MVVLINENSASASEIVSGALQDHDRALILGETSFGKALVQTIYPIEGKRGLALTTGKYYTPSERLIQRDYSESFWDYYNNRTEDDNNSTEYFTDSGRIVYGGGGITPDEIVEQARFNREVRRIRGNFYREFASKLYSKEIQTDVQKSFPDGEPGSFSDEEVDQIIQKIQISEATFSAFHSYIQEHKVEISDEDFNKNRDVISNLLKQELLLLLVGDEASYKTAMDLDKQVQTAISRLPEARVLLEKHLAEIKKNQIKSL
jgi:carboxyl-terminal processing protease